MSAVLTMLPGLICDASMFADTGLQPATCIVGGFEKIDRLEAMAERVLLEGPARMALLGHSMGARVALEVVRRAPERVERLALVSTGVHGCRPGERASRHALRDIGRAQGMAALVDAWLPPMIAPVNRQRVIEKLRIMCEGASVEIFAAQTEALLHRPEVETLLPTIACPTWVIVGAEDAWSPPAQHQAIAAAIPGAVLRIIPDAGHMLPAESPYAFAQVVREWLDPNVSMSKTLPRGETA